MEHYRKVLGDCIGALPGVRETHTYCVMETVVEGGDIARSHLDAAAASYLE
jgi:hypothetical protein